jgi:hypothetical protein
MTTCGMINGQNISRSRRLNIDKSLLNDYVYLIGATTFTTRPLRVQAKRKNKPKEKQMLEVTSAAIEQIGGYFTNREPEPIRVFLNEGG